MNMKYLPLYYKWIQEGRLPHDGLCHSLPDRSALDLFDDEGFSNYWGAWAEFSETSVMSYELTGKEHENLLYGFTGLRQNIVLFLAAMNDEL